MVSSILTSIGKKFLLIFLTFYLMNSNPVMALTHPTIISIALGNPNMLNNGMPKVGKCCPVGEIMAKDRFGIVKCSYINSTSDYGTFSPYFSQFNRSGILVPGDQKDAFVAIIGDPCQGKRFILEPEVSSDDDNYLLMNGSIFGPKTTLPMLSPGVDYCMEIVPGRGLRTIVCYKDENVIKSGDDFRLTFYACGLLISVPFLIFTIVAYCITPRLMDALGKALCFYCGCLAVAFSNLAMVQLVDIHLGSELCLSIAFVIQFSFVACFFWLNVMCIETYFLVRRYVLTGHTSSSQPKKLFFYYTLWAWTPSALLIVLSILTDITPIVPTSFVKPKFSKHSCSFESDNDAMPYFYIPVGLLVIFNIVLFVMTAIAITKHQQELDLRRLREDRPSHRNARQTLSRLKQLFIVCLSLFFIMAMNWAMEVISWLADSTLLVWSAFDVVNALQGIIIFSIFVLRKRVRQLVYHQVQIIRGVIDPDEPIPVV